MTLGEALEMVHSVASFHYDNDENRNFYPANFKEALDTVEDFIVKHCDDKEPPSAGEVFTMLHQLADKEEETQTTNQFAFARVHSSNGTVLVDRRGNVIDVVTNGDENPCQDAGHSDIFAFGLTHIGVPSSDGYCVMEYDILELPAYCNDGYVDPAVWPMGINPDSDEQDKETPVELEYPT